MHRYFIDVIRISIKNKDRVVHVKESYAGKCFRLGLNSQVQ